MNGISDHGCTALSQLLQNNDSLTHLNISNTRLRDKDAVKLVSALLKNESLRSLNVSIIMYIAEQLFDLEFHLLYYHTFPVIVKHSLKLCGIG